MPEESKGAADKGRPPKAIIERRWRPSAIWIVPVVAAVLAGWLVYQRVSASGPTIIILFEDGSGLKSGQTPVRYRGVNVGEVRSVGLSPDQKHVKVEAKLDRSAAGLAREGAAFWIVRPEISLGAVRGLGTLVSGPYLQVKPGTGKPQKRFVGLKGSSLEMNGDGLELVLMAPKLGFVRDGSPVLYRGVEVGAVLNYELAPDAKAVAIRAHIEKPYVPLVRLNSKFWDAGGVNIDWGLFQGLDVSADSFKTLVLGGVAFATPDAPDSRPVPREMIFRLHEKAEEAWLTWSPNIALELED